MASGSIPNRVASRATIIVGSTAPGGELTPYEATYHFARGYFDVCPDLDFTNRAAAREQCILLILAVCGCAESAGHPRDPKPIIAALADRYPTVAAWLRARAS
jgi:hypothetical protein